MTEIIETTGQHINLIADFLPARQPNASCFIFFADPHFLKTILASRTSGTFGFAPTHKANASQNQKSHFLANAPLKDIFLYYKS
jgi:hypothetical protein